MSNEELYLGQRLREIRLPMESLDVAQSYTRLLTDLLFLQTDPIRPPEFRNCTTYLSAIAQGQSGLILGAREDALKDSLSYLIGSKK